MKFGIMLGKSNFEFSVITTVIVLFCVAVLVSTTICITDELKNRPSEENLSYYKFKSNQYQGILHNLVSQLKESKPEVYNNFAVALNEINKAALKVGEPIDGDQGALIQYEVDTIGTK